MKYGIMIFLCFLSLQLSAMSLDEYLGVVKSRNRAFISFEKSTEAAVARREAGDIELSPTAMLKAQTLDDRRPQALGTFLVNRQQTTEYTLGLGKKFSSGTQAQVTADASELKMDASDLSSQPPSTLTQTLGQGSLGLNLSQSLWKDGFGRSTRLRRERQSVIESSEKQNYNLQAKQLLVDAEAAFWDYLYLKQESLIRQDSLERAQKIEQWIKRRVGNGIGDSADLFNAQGLRAGRELQLISTQDEMTAAEKKVRDTLELKDDEPLPTLQGDIGGVRNLTQMSDGHGNKKVRLDSYLAVLEAKTKAISAEEIEDSYRPDLVLSGQYKTNSFEATLDEAGRKITNTDKPTAGVALTLTWLLDGDLKNSARQTARAEALAAALRQERKLLESNSSWSEIIRRHGELTRKVQAAQVASDLQTKKANAERDKLSKGRSITSEVVLAEQDAAESQLTLNKLRAEQRKLEAQGRLFITLEE